MKALTVRQPHASLIADGFKRIETRPRPTSYRGLVAIHAALAFPPKARDRCLISPFFEALTKHRDQALDLPLGMVIATAELVDVCRIDQAFADQLAADDAVLGEHEATFGDYTPGGFAWLLNFVTPLPEPIPAKGALGLWEWTP